MPCSVILGFVPAEHVFQPHAEDARDAEGTFERRGIATLFDGDHGLPRNADLLGKGGLAHPVMSLAQLLDAIRNRGAFRHASHAPTVEEYLERIFRNLAQHQGTEDDVEQQVSVAEPAKVPEAAKCTDGQHIA